MKDFEKMIEEARKEAYCEPKTQEMEISIEEYVALREMEKLFTFFLTAIESDFALNYNGSEIHLVGSTTQNMYKFLFPGKYNEIFEAKKKEKKDGSLRANSEVDG